MLLEKFKLKVETLRPWNSNCIVLVFLLMNGNYESKINKYLCKPYYFRFIIYLLLTLWQRSSFLKWCRAGLYNLTKYSLATLKWNECTVGGCMENLGRPNDVFIFFRPMKMPISVQKVFVNYFALSEI